MCTYLYTGKVLPERAPLSYKTTTLRFQKNGGRAEDSIDVNISVILNQVAVHVSSNREWDIFDLRNIIRTMLLNQLASIGYLKGYSYDLDITRVYSKELDMDTVFGIDIPCLSHRENSTDLGDDLNELFKKSSGINGVLINRCLHDLALSIKYADDTAFYCYRAIESLRKHSAITAGLQSKSDSIEWVKFREKSGCDRRDIDKIKKYADPLRHGGLCETTSREREDILTTTWGIVRKYIDALETV